MILERFSLKGKTALVTGSSRGLGAGIAIALAEAGANVAVHGLHAVPQATRDLVNKAGRESIALVGDVSDAAVCASLVEQVVEHFGRIDILVNNAGIIRRSPAIEHSEADWRAVIDTDLTSSLSAGLSGRSTRTLLRGGQGRGRSTDEGLRQ
jgi:2-deoxy-D-gluconate 3-dehydrogenase